MSLQVISATNNQQDGVTEAIDGIAKILHEALQQRHKQNPDEAKTIESAFLNGLVDFDVSFRFSAEGLNEIVCTTVSGEKRRGFFDIQIPRVRQ